MNKTAIAIVLTGGVFAAALTVNVGAQAAKSVNDGVYAADQATKGEAVYKEQCAACHGDNLEGSGPMPPLAGKDFLANWQGKTIGDLFEKTQTSMPATAPGTLTPAQTSEIMAYLLQVGKYPTGAAPMSDKMDDLKQITIDNPK
jgi:S-disulfanyl-L-cysteine oxidoreductase SoxD